MENNTFSCFSFKLTTKKKAIMRILLYEISMSRPILLEKFVYNLYAMIFHFCANNVGYNKCAYLFYVCVYPCVCSIRVFFKPFLTLNSNKTNFVQDTIMLEIQVHSNNLHGFSWWNVTEILNFA